LTVPGLARITIIFCLFAHLNNVNKFMGFHVI
jgi:hypothetical protein